MVNPTSLPGVHMQNDGIMQCTAAQLLLRSDRLSDTGICDHKHAAIASHIRSRGEKASSVVSQSIRPNSSVGVGHVNKIVMHKLQTTAVDAWVGYGSKRQMADSAQVMFLLHIGWIECRLAGGWIPVKKWVIWQTSLQQHRFLLKCYQKLHNFDHKRYSICPLATRQRLN